MMITNNFLYFKTKKSFQESLSEIKNTSIAFIEDSSEIYTHGNFFSNTYQCPGALQVLTNWSTTDVESIVGNWDEFTKAVSDGKAIIASTYWEDRIYTDVCMVVLDLGYYNLYVTVGSFQFVFLISEDEAFLGYENVTLREKDVVDSLSDSRPRKPLSAKQGKILNEKIAEISNPASAEKDGLMSKEDKEKIDGIQFSEDGNSVWFNGKKYGVHLFKDSIYTLSTSSSHQDIVNALNGLDNSNIKSFVDTGVIGVFRLNESPDYYQGIVTLGYEEEEPIHMYLYITDNYYNTKYILINISTPTKYVVEAVKDSSLLREADVANSLTLTSTTTPLSAAMGKKLQDEKLAKSDVVNNLTTTDTSKALSAAQGKVLNDKIEGIKSINNPTQLTNQNLDDIKEIGYYYSVGGNSVSSKPSGVNHFYLQVSKTGQNGINQLIISEDNFYTRGTDGSTAEGNWSDWEKINKEIGLSTSTTDGLMSSSDKIKLDFINLNKKNTSSVQNIDTLILEYRNTLVNTNIKEDPVGGFAINVAKNDRLGFTAGMTGGGSGDDLGYALLYTGDNGNEPIYVCQYANGGTHDNSNSLKHSITLMDSSGNQTFNDVTLNNISGGKLKDYTKIEYSEENIISNQSTITEAIEILESTVESNEIVTANALVDLNSRLLELKDNEIDTTQLENTNYFSSCKNITNIVKVIDTKLHELQQALTLKSK